MSLRQTGQAASQGGKQHPLERNRIGSFTLEDHSVFLETSPDTTCKPMTSAYHARIHSEESKTYARKYSVNGLIERHDVINHSSRKTLPPIPSADLSSVDM
jgi:hypothetical protein